jgi:hypothetical protein
MLEQKLSEPITSSPAHRNRGDDETGARKSGNLDYSMFRIFSNMRQICASGEFTVQIFLAVPGRVSGVHS